jgi:hypothetical protein
MLIVDEAVETSSGDKVAVIEHKSVKSYEEEKALYVRPLPREKNLPNLREIAGNKAYEYIIGKRYYTLQNENDEVEASIWTRKFKMAVAVVAMGLGVGILLMIKYGG